ncbi:MAG TPA: TetR/AcrR family transcriptional regulator [Solirubrobacterales bacterium]|jgi:AcrR family transcriptional regulator
MTTRDSTDLLRRELILETAAPVFAELGYRETWSGDLLAAAGIPRDTLHPYFADKEACFLAVLDRLIADGEAQIAAATRGRRGWARQTYAALGALLEAMDAGSPTLRLLLIEVPTAGTAALSRYDRVVATAVHWLYQARGRYKPAAKLPDSFEQMVVDGVAFILRHFLLESPRPSMPDLLLETSRYLIEPFVGPDEFRRLDPEFTAPF